MLPLGSERCSMAGGRRDIAAARDQRGSSRLQNNELHHRKTTSCLDLDSGRYETGCYRFEMLVTPFCLASKSRTPQISNCKQTELLFVLIWALTLVSLIIIVVDNRAASTSAISYWLQHQQSPIQRRQHVLLGSRLPQNPSLCPSRISPEPTPSKPRGDRATDERHGKAIG